MLDLQKIWNEGEFLSQLVAGQLELLLRDSPMPAFSKHSDLESENRRYLFKLKKQAEAELLREISGEQCIAVGRALHLPGWPLARIRPEIAPEVELTPDENSAQWGQEKYDRVRIKRTAPLSPSSEASGSHARKAAAKAGGRPNAREEAKALIREQLSDPKFLALSNRTEQAVEIRALLKGEKARHSHDMPGYKTDTIRRWIGEVENE